MSHWHPPCPRHHHPRPLTGSRHVHTVTSDSMWLNVICHYPLSAIISSTQETRKIKENPTPHHAPEPRVGPTNFPNRTPTLSHALLLQPRGPPPCDTPGRFSSQSLCPCCALCQECSLLRSPGSWLLPSPSSWRGLLCPASCCVPVPGTEPGTRKCSVMFASKGKDSWHRHYTRVQTWRLRDSLSTCQFSCTCPRPPSHLPFKKTQEFPPPFPRREA